jgi:hypothetical protein
MLPRKKAALAADAVAAALRDCGGSLSAAARQLGCSRQNIHRRLGRDPALRALVDGAALEKNQVFSSAPAAEVDAGLTQMSHQKTDAVDGEVADFGEQKKGADPVNRGVGGGETAGGGAVDALVSEQKKAAEPQPVNLAAPAVKQVGGVVSVTPPLPEPAPKRRREAKPEVKRATPSGVARLEDSFQDGAGWTTIWREGGFR